MDNIPKNMDLLLPVSILDRYMSYQDAYQHMLNQEVTDLGWLNAGIKVPEDNYMLVYQNRSGSSCLFVQPIKRIMYSVDMGD